MKIVLVAFLSLSLGVAAGYCLFGTGDSSGNVPSDGVQEEKIRNRSGKNPDNEIKMLKERIRSLERRLRKTRERKDESKEEINAVSEQPEPRGPMQMREHMERMAREDPERYQQITNRFAQFRQNRAKRAASRIEFLSSIDTSRMSEKARRTHDELLDTIIQQEALEKKMHDVNLSDQERMEMFGQMRQLGERMQELSEIERDNLLTQTARELGFGASDAKEITSAIKEVIEATSPYRHMRRPRR